ncbi:MAG: hypothetical protein QM722_23120 [Piscinibacter sp.]
MFTEPTALSLGGDFGMQTVTGIERLSIVLTAYDDALRSSATDDSIVAGDGNDSVDGAAGNDSIAGQAGDDAISGDLGDDTLDGGAGNDAAVFSFGSVVYASGIAFDASAVGTSASVSLADGSGGVDQLIDIEYVRVFGSSTLNDTLIGSVNGDVMFGGTGGGDDLIDGGAGNDTLGGGGANQDTAAGGSPPVGGGAGGAYVPPIMFVGGADSADGGNDTVLGGAGDDLIIASVSGDGFSDFIDGGSGDDTLVLDYSAYPGDPMNPNPLVVQLNSTGNRPARHAGGHRPGWRLRRAVARRHRAPVRHADGTQRQLRLHRHHRHDHRRPGQRQHRRRRWR